MGLREDMECLRGDVLEESWSSASKLFPGVRDPLFRAVVDVSAAISTMKGGYRPGIRSSWGKDLETAEAEKGVPLTRDFAMVERGSFGNYVFVSDKSKLQTKYRVSPVLSPFAVAMTQTMPGGAVFAEKLKDVSIGTYKAKPHNVEAEERVWTDKNIPPSFIDGVILLTMSRDVDLVFIEDHGRMWLAPFGTIAAGYVDQNAFMEIAMAAKKAHAVLIVKDPLVMRGRRAQRGGIRSFVRGSNIVASKFGEEKGYYKVSGVLPHVSFDMREVDDGGGRRVYEYHGKWYVAHSVKTEQRPKGGIFF